MHQIRVFLNNPRDKSSTNPGLLANSLSDVSSICYSGYEGEDYVKKRRSVASLKASHKREKSGIEQGTFYIVL